jgi:hypothetical protein
MYHSGFIYDWHKERWNANGKLLKETSSQVPNLNDKKNAFTLRYCSKLDGITIRDI